jgi:hypothetical protein
VPDPPDDGVGPVLVRGPTSEALVAAIRGMNAGVAVLDRGAYLRVSAPRRCTVTRAAIEAVLGRTFRLPRDLEPLMPSFKGRLCVTTEGVEWSFEGRETMR